jgi:hypothetical protein
MSQPVAFCVFVTLLVMMTIWVVFLSWFFRYLRNRHPSTYAAIGSPSLFWNNSMRSQWLFMRFVCTSQWRELDDSVVSKSVRGIRIFFVLYVLGFLGFVSFIFSTEFHPREAEADSQSQTEPPPANKK